MKMDKTPEYTNHAVTSTDVCPDLVAVADYGHHRSLLSDGKRYWVFEEEAGRDLFLIHEQQGKFRRGK